MEEECRMKMQFYEDSNLSFVTWIFAHDTIEPMMGNIALYKTGTLDTYFISAIRETIKNPIIKIEFKIDVIMTQ